MEGACTSMRLRVNGAELPLQSLVHGWYVPLPPLPLLAHLEEGPPSPAVRPWCADLDWNYACLVAKSGLSFSD